MDQGSLVIPQIEAGARLIHEFAKYAPVHAAFWIKGSERGSWLLYIASDRLDDSNTTQGYGEVMRIWLQSQDPWLEPIQVVLVGTTNPVARAVTELQRKHPSQAPRRYQGGRLGGVTVDDVYIYPLPTAAPA